MATQPFDMAAILQAFAAMQQLQGQQNLQGIRELRQTPQRGIGGGYIDPATGREPENPFDTGFFKDSASQMSPEARLASQGDSAMNQWAALGALPGVDKNLVAGFNQQRQNEYMPRPAYNPLEGALGASPAPYAPNPGAFTMTAPLTSPTGNPMTDSLNLEQAQGLYAPGGFARPARVPVRRPTAYRPMSAASARYRPAAF